MMQESTRSPPIFATAVSSTIAEEARWPSVAFADDVKPPMLSGTVGHQLPPVIQPSSSLPPILPSPPSMMSHDSPLPAPSLLRLGSDAPLLDKGGTDPDKHHQVREASESPRQDISLSQSKSTALSVKYDDKRPLLVLVVDDNQITRNTMTRCVPLEFLTNHTRF